MKILIDENLPLKLKENFGWNHEIYTIREMNWHGKQNGELLGLMILGGFEGYDWSEFIREEPKVIIAAFNRKSLNVGRKPKQLWKFRITWIRITPVLSMKIFRLMRLDN